MRLPVVLYALGSGLIFLVVGRLSVVSVSPHATLPPVVNPSGRNFDERLPPKQPGDAVAICVLHLVVVLTARHVMSRHVTSRHVTSRHVSSLRSKID